MKKNKTIYATIGRPPELLELNEAINYYGISKVYITITNKSRLEKNAIAIFFKENNPEILFEYLDYDFTNKKVADYNSFLESYKNEFDLYALALGYNRPIYKLSRLLKERKETIVHISDGAPHAFSLFGYILGFRTRSIITFLKGCYIYFEYKKAKADVCFFSLYPNTCCFSKKTLPIKENLEYRPKGIESIKDIETLVVSGWGMNTEELITYFDINNSYCASSKDLNININGKVIELEEYITGEDIVNFSNIKRVVGTASTVLLYAKNKYPHLEVDCVLTGVLNETFGIFFESEWKKLGKKMGINFYKK